MCDVFSWGCEGISSFTQKQKKNSQKFSLFCSSLRPHYYKLIVKWKNVFDDTMMSTYAFAVEF